MCRNLPGNLKKRPDNVALPSRKLLFPDTCLIMKSNFYSDSEEVDLASGRCSSVVRTAAPAEASRHCGAFGHLQRPVRTVA
jgi:hypothetical protein